MTIEVNFFTENQDYVAEYHFNSDAELAQFLARSRADQVDGREWRLTGNASVKVESLTLYTQPGWIMLVGEL